MCRMSCIRGRPRVLVESCVVKLCLSFSKYVRSTSFLVQMMRLANIFVFLLWTNLSLAVLDLDAATLKLSKPRTGVAGAAAGNFALFAGGCSPGSCDIVDILDVTIRLWTT